MTTTRIFVGGLGERVTEEDLRKTFSTLGSVNAVDIVRTKDRSFAYIDFLPSSDNSLPKLFSMYNGCSWKGGKLKLEKAKEHYIDRLKKEWAEDAELKSSEHINHVDENMVASEEPKSTVDSEKLQIRIFFPKLRKVKPLPFRGTGKHKYSFQRVEVPSLPVHFCDCPEHSDPVQTPKETRVDDSKIQDVGINEQEINLMNSVMKKLFDRTTPSKPKLRDVKDYTQQNVPTSDIPVDIPVDTNEIDDGTDDDDDIQMNIGNGQDNVQSSDFPVDPNEIDDEGTDDDDIKINTVAGGNNGSFSPETWGQQTSLGNEIGRSNEWSYDDLVTQNKAGIQKNEVKPSNKKRKPLSNESNERDMESTMHQKKARLQTRSNESEDHMGNSNSVTQPGTKKSSWKERFGDGGSSSFNLSQITHGAESNNEERPEPSSETSSDSKENERVNDIVVGNLDGQSTQENEREGVIEGEPGEPSLDSDKSARGSSWLQKSSWTQLVGGGANSSFSISQILPGNILEKQNSHKPIGSRGSKSSLAFSGKKKDTQIVQVSDSRGIMLNKDRSVNDLSNSIMEKKADLESKQESNSLPGVGMGVGETCPFMRSADSLKEWMTAKTALSGALKKKKQQ